MSIPLTLTTLTTLLTLLPSTIAQGISSSGDGGNDSGSDGQDFSFPTPVGSGSSSSNPSNLQSSATTSFPSPSPDTTTDSDDTHDSHIYYYIVIIVVIVAFLGVVALIVTKRQQRSRQMARARALNDMEAAQMQRRLVDTSMRHRWGWGGGTRLTGPGMVMPSIPMQTTTPQPLPPMTRSSGRMAGEEGLDEHGEAPPPYSPKSEDEEGPGKVPKYEEVEVELVRPPLVHHATNRNEEEAQRSVASESS